MIMIMMPYLTLNLVYNNTNCCWNFSIYIYFFKITSLRITENILFYEP